MVVAVTRKNNKFGLNQCEKSREGRVVKQNNLVNLSFLTHYFPSFRARSCFLKLLMKHGDELFSLSINRSECLSAFQNPKTKTSRVF